jgi:fibronectin type 3 domain-containing protein
MKYTDEQGLGDNTTYYYKVTAYNGDGKETSPSVPASATTKGRPPVVEGLKAAAGQVKQVTLEWKDNPQEEVRGYVIYRSGETYGTYTRIDKISGRDKKSFVDKKLDDNGTYCYRLTTYNKVDVESEMSDAVCAVTKPRPAMPTGLSGTDLQVKKIPLKWSANAEKDIKYYHVYRSIDDGKKFDHIAKQKDQTEFIDESLKDGTAYIYKIQAEDADGLLSDFSGVVTVSTKPLPKKPSGLKADSSGGTVSLSWTANSEKDIDHYVIYEKGIFSNTAVSQVSSTSVTIKGLEPGKTKDYLITAVDKAGLESEPSDVVSIPVK